MNMLRLSLLLSLALPLLVACQKAPESPTPQPQPQPATADSDAPQTALGRTVEKAINEARQELQNENISISDGFNINVNGHGVTQPDNLPKAEITPQGDLLIEGKPVAVDAAQRKLLMDYRGHIIAIAETGMAMGVKGADLAGKAISETIGGLFSGNTEQIEQKIEAEAMKLEADAMKLCAQLPPMLATQQQLAASLPAFKPYATMTKEDIDDCGKDWRNDEDRAQLQQQIREEIHVGIRKSIQGAAQATGLAAMDQPAGDTATDAASGSSNR